MSTNQLTADILEGAELLGVPVDELRQWERAGRLPKRVKFPNGDRRWIRADLACWLESLRDEVTG